MAKSLFIHILGFWALTMTFGIDCSCGVYTLSTLMILAFNTGIATWKITGFAFPLDIEFLIENLAFTLAINNSC